jgi:agmatinase
MHPIERYLRPPGHGIPTVSTGGAEALKVSERTWGTRDIEAIRRRWRADLERYADAETVLLGIPCDTGAGFFRGAAYGPAGIRLAHHATFGPLRPGTLDLGDVVAVPQLLHDGMLSADQLRATRAALYPEADEGDPVAPLSVAERVLDLVLEENPDARLAVLGGDHSAAWPAMAALGKRFAGKFAVVHFDAHTDLLESRYGVKYCFATWAYHALRFVPAGGMIQLGIRVSGKPKAHWESTLGVRQFWAEEVLDDPAGTIDEVVRQLRRLNVERVYVSNDVDGTDPSEAPATGTPEAGGLPSAFVEETIAAVRRAVPLVGGDVVELAPPLGKGDWATEEPTCRLGARYLEALLR